MTHNYSAMANFDDNPFADPFAEPSIQQATRNTSGLEEYDPFSGKQTTNNAPPPTAQIGNTGNPPTYVQPTISATNQPAVVNPTPTTPANQPPAYTSSAQQQVTTAEFQRRQEELERKAEELARKEEELKNAGAGGATRQDNWPPLPSFCPVGPCFYQDINVDIPLEFQKVVRMLYYLWMFHVLMLMLNILGGLGMFIALSDGATFGLAIVYFVIFTPLSFVCWFRPVYKAFRSDSSINFMVFFLVFCAQLIVSIINAIGIPSTGSCGWVAVGKAFNNGYVALGIFMTLIALASTFLAGAMGYSLIWVHRIYRSTGASFAKAQAEFSQGVMKNEHVQSATANAASAVIRNQMSQATTPANNSAAGPRF